MLNRPLLLSMVFALGACASLESRDSDEAQIRKLYASMDRALASGDVAVFEDAFAPEYVFSHHFGRFVSRADNLDYLRKLSSAPTFRILEATSDDVAVRISGEMAWVTAAWRVVIVSLQPGGIPHEDKGRYTGIYRKSDGRWRVVAEHLSEALHDPAVLKREAIAASEDYRKLRRESGDLAWAGDIAEHEFRVIDNATVLETGLLQGSLRYTAVWSWRDLRWQVLSMQFSAGADPAEVPTSTGRR